MNIILSYSKYNTFLSCPMKYAHQYLYKTVVIEEMAYPLVMGQLVHLFIKLYNDGTYTKNQIRDMKDNLEVLYDLVDLKYPSIYNNVVEIKEMDITKNTANIIEYIANNDVVFFHALKLFNSYRDNIYFKVNQASNFLSETTFHNIIELPNNITCCLYGSIDLLFYKLEKEILKYLYISDFKTGKKLYSYYIEQLYFYFYNIKNYNYNVNKNISNTTDDFETIFKLKNLINSNDNIHLLLFNLRENVNEKTILSDVNDKYEQYTHDLFVNITDCIHPMHVDKDTITVDDIHSKYKDVYKFVEKNSCKQDECSFSCGYCKFKDLCDYRIKK